MRTKHDAIKVSKKNISFTLNNCLKKLQYLPIRNLIIAQDREDFFDKYILHDLFKIDLNIIKISGSDLQDMYILSQCKYLILSKHSTYSEWIYHLTRKKYSKTIWF